MPVKTLAGFLLLLLASLHGQTPAPPTADDLMAEFVAQHDEGVKRLDIACIQQLQAEKQLATQAGNLHGANAIDDVLRQVQDGTLNPTALPKTLPSPVAVLVRDHAARKATAVATLAKNYLARFNALKAQPAIAGDPDALAEVDRCLLEISTFIKPIPGVVVDEITIEAYIDGNTTLHITRDGLHWQTDGNVAKPGLHNKSFYPTYINGNAWIPQWKAQATRGTDTSDTYPITTAAPQLKLEHIATSRDRSAPHEPGRALPKEAFTKNEFTVLIADPESGARWQKFRLKTAK
ncbi:MAG TPA: hypothetical protein VD994_22095 [Prosthecobacter sp.]|nr:hypothetical protein [Prosthecobacter sp.]